MSNEWKYRKLKLLERWEAIRDRLKIRQQINTHPYIVISVCLCSGLLLLWILASVISSKPPAYEFESHKKAYYYDLNTGELFSASIRSIPPIKAPSGNLPDGQPAGVRAHVLQFFIEGSSQGDPFIGWLEKQDPAVEKSTYLQSQTARGDDWGKGMLIKGPADEQWVKANTSQGRAIIEKARKPNRQGNTSLPVYPD